MINNQILITSGFRFNNGFGIVAAAGSLFYGRSHGIGITN